MIKTAPTYLMFPCAIFSNYIESNSDSDAGKQESKMYLINPLLTQIEKKFNICGAIVVKLKVYIDTASVFRTGL